MLDKDTPYDIKQALYNAGIGGAVGGLFGGGRVFAQDILPRADTRDSANSGSDIASEMKPGYNQVGGEMDGRTEETAGLYARRTEGDRTQFDNDAGRSGRTVESACKEILWTRLAEKEPSRTAGNKRRRGKLCPPGISGRDGNRNCGRHRLCVPARIH